MNKPKNEPAFPVESCADHEFTGMSLRDYFAAKAMQAMLTRDCPVCTSGMAKDAYIYADAMLAARSA